MFEDTVDLLYESVSDPTLWSEVGSRLARQFDAQSFWFLKIAPDGAQIPIAANVSPEMKHRYETYYHKVDVLVEAAIHRLDDFLDRPCREQDLIDQHTWLNSELYNDLGLPHGVGHFLGCYLGDGSQGNATSLSFFREPGAALFEDRIQCLYNLYVPHIKRSLRLSERLKKLAIPMAPLMSDLLETIPASILLLSASLRVVHANGAARRSLDQKQFITIRDGRLGAVDPNGNHKIDALLHRIATGKVRSGEIIVGDSVKSWHVSAFRVSDQSTTAIRSIGCHIWVWITDLANMRDSLTSRLNSFFHLTPAELRVALSLEKGLSAKDIAGLNQVSVTTVRSQIQSVFSKTGVNRQSELVALLAKLGGTPRR